MGLEVGIQILDGDRGGAGDLLIDPWDTEAPFALAEGILTALYDTGVDEGLLEPLTFGEGVCHRICIDDEETYSSPDLRSSQTDPVGEVHRLPHIGDEVLKTFVLWGNILPYLP